jgi:integrase
MAVRKIKDSWWVDFRFNHSRYRKRSPENSKAGAEAYEAVLRRKLARGESLDAVSHIERQEANFRQFAWKWFETYVVPNNKFLEQRAKRYILQKCLVPFFGSMPLEKITTRHIEEYKAHALKKGVARKTVNNQLAVLSKCITTAYEWLDLPGKPPKIAWLKCPPPTTDFLSADECTLLMSKADGVIRDMILTALRTGMRQGELRGLQWSCIDWQNGILTVRYSRCPRTGELMSPKSNRERHIPLEEDVYEMLLKKKRDTGYVFLDSRGKPFGSETLIRRLRDVRYEAGLRPLGWHTLRHTFATHLAMLGVPLNTIQKLLGHSTIGMTMRYSHVAPSTLRAAINMLNPKTRVQNSFGQQVGNLWAASIQQEPKDP